jgi:hypothetical protein
MQNQKSLKIILEVLCVIVVVIFVFTYFIYNDIRQKNKNYSLFTKDLNFQNTKKDYLDSSQKTIDSISLELNEINSSIVSKEGEVQFIETLESLAKRTGLGIEINSLVFDANSTSNSVDILKVKAQTNGSWIDSYKFIKLLESMPFKIKINKLNLIHILSENNWQTTFEIDVLKYK